jgi:hypothetical protein
MTLLARLGVPARCISNERKASEHGRWIRFELPAHCSVECVKVDGCWFQQGDPERVDFLFLITSSQQLGTLRAVLVELKGKDFDKALSQIDSTLQRLKGLPAWRGAQDMETFVFVVLSSGRQVSRSQERLRALQKRHGVRIKAKEHMVITAEGIDLR